MLWHEGFIILRVEWITVFCREKNKISKKLKKHSIKGVSTGVTHEQYEYLHPEQFCIDLAKTHFSS